jgi:hypothetical protein
MIETIQQIVIAPAIILVIIVLGAGWLLGIAFAVSVFVKDNCDPFSPYPDWRLLFPVLVTFAITGALTAWFLEALKT